MYDFINVPRTYREELRNLVNKILIEYLDSHDPEFVETRDMVLEEIDEAFDIDY